MLPLGTVQCCLEITATYQPRGHYTEDMPPDTTKMEVRWAQRILFKRKFGIDLPEWWPTHSFGEYVSHVLRFEDERDARGLGYCPPTEAISHNVKAPGVVDFTNEGVKKIALAHVDKISEGDWPWRPSLSTSIDQDRRGVPFPLLGYQPQCGQEGQ